MYCHICGAQDAVIRFEELKTALITGKAHVDCNGHSQYRPINKPHDIDESTRIHMSRKELKQNENH
jgi:hypothetical protein